MLGRVGIAVARSVGRGEERTALVGADTEPEDAARESDPLGFGFGLSSEGADADDQVRLVEDG